LRVTGISCSAGLPFSAFLLTDCSKDSATATKALTLIVNQRAMASMVLVIVAVNCFKLGSFDFVSLNPQHFALDSPYPTSQVQSSISRNTFCLSHPRI
jgi:hypothetical protein